MELTIQGLDNTYLASYRYKGRGDFTWRLPIGRYSIIGTVVPAAPNGDTTLDYATDLFALPEIDITGTDQQYSVDAAKATDLRLDVRGEKRRLEPSQFSLQLRRVAPEGGAEPQLRGVTDVLNSSDEKYGVIPSGTARTGELTLSTYVAVREPLQTLRVTGPGSRDIPVRTPVNVTRFDGTKNVELVNAKSGSAADFASLDVKGKAALITASNMVGISEQARNAAAAGRLADRRPRRRRAAHRLRRHQPADPRQRGRVRRGRVAALPHRQGQGPHRAQGGVRVRLHLLRAVHRHRRAARDDGQEARRPRLRHRQEHLPLRRDPPRRPRDPVFLGPGRHPVTPRLPVSR
ncbi:hypothetical protein ACIQ6K_39680 [Streptomyces sp. NPDC096354]|uniref:hypothetical protein n=1 Tax=Streptomyces sp. NPDC096354 TaxID=3366088 RepID=UPI0037F224E7